MFEQGRQSGDHVVTGVTASAVVAANFSGQCISKDMPNIRSMRENKPAGRRQGIWLF